jgi:hypothetical protein
MTRHEWIRDTLQKAFLQIDIGAADFRELDVEDSAVGFEFRTGNFAQFDGGVRFGNDSDQRHERRVKEKGKSKK